MLANMCSFCLTDANMWKPNQTDALMLSVDACDPSVDPCMLQSKHRYAFIQTAKAASVVQAGEVHAPLH